MPSETLKKLEEANLSDLFAVTQNFRTSVLATYPALVENRSYRAFIAHLFFPRKLDRSNKQVVIPGTLIADCMGMRKQYDSGNCKGPNRTGAFLERFIADVLPDFKYSDKHGGKGRARTAKSLGLPNDLLSAAEKCSTTYGVVKCDFVSGIMLTKSAISKLQADQVKMVELELDEKPVPGEELIRFLNHKVLTPARTFDSVRASCSKAATEASKLDNDNSRRAALTMIAGIDLAPKPIYRPSKKSSRLNAFYPSLFAIHSDLRRTVTPEWLEFDLRSAGIATVSKLWDLKDLHDDLSSGIDVVGVVSEELSQGACGRKAVKQMFHSVCLGRHRGSLRKHLLEELSKECAAIPENVTISKVLGKSRLCRSLPISRPSFRTQIRDQKAFSAIG